MLIIAWGVGSLLLCLLLWWAFSAWVTSPAAAIQSRIDSMNASLERRRVDIDRAAGVNDRIESIAARTLGSTTEAVDHALRSRLAALAEAAAVTDVRVGTSPPVEVESPGRREFKGSQRSLGKEPDFMLVGATVAARGTWSQVGLLVESIQAESWPHRITKLRLTARDGGAQVEVSLQLQALFIPGAGPQEAATFKPPPAQRVALALPNPFAPPAPPTPPKPPPAQDKPPRPIADPWQVVHVGLVRGEAEVLLQSPRGKRKRLVPGDSHQGMTLEAVTPDADGIDEATFAADGARWTIPAGSLLKRP
ncbi:MAG: hypothetical protein MK101_00845 [Phycisphaerales bacterium]|nr:hypothetical protein [Phycisphaerales bacterium]